MLKCNFKLKIKENVKTKEMIYYNYVFQLHCKIIGVRLVGLKR